MGEFRFNAKTVDEAITQACIELGVTSDKISYNVIDQGSKGFLGIGARNCIISVKVEDKSAVENNKSVEKNIKPAADKVCAENNSVETAERNNTVKVEKSAVVDKKAENITEAASTVDNSEIKSEDNSVKSRNDFKRERKNNDRRYDNRSERRLNERDEKAPREEREIKPIVLAEDPVERAKTFLESLFKTMEMNINYSGEYASDINELTVNLSGEDMGVLIGKRGQTLDALQYLTSQVVNKHQNGYIRVKLDTENYRERRKETLENFAVNMAHKVKRNKRPVVLEPMNAYERRIIHSVLQNEKDVLTRSEGEEPYRHVVICPVRKKNNSRQIQA